jgi:hypothetical protein
VCAGRVDPSALAFSLSSHRYSCIGLLLALTLTLNDKQQIITPLRIRVVSQCVVCDRSDDLSICLVVRVCFSDSLVLVILLTDSLIIINGKLCIHQLLYSS